MLNGIIDNSTSETMREFRALHKCAQAEVINKLRRFLKEIPLDTTNSVDERNKAAIEWCSNLD